MRKLLAAAFGILLMAAPARAQDDKKYDINVGFGPTIPTGGFKDSFNTGWNGAIGGTYYVTPTVGVGAEYMYHHMDGPSKVISVSPTPGGGVATAGTLESNQQIHSVTFNVIARSKPSDSHLVGGYAIGGFGYYHRKIEITTPSVGYATVCDPYWLICYPALVPVDRIIGDRSSNDFGINIGGGVTFGYHAKFYVETRFHYVWGPEVNPPAGISSVTGVSNFKANAQYLPITFGVRF